MKRTAASLPLASRTSGGPTVRVARRSLWLLGLASLFGFACMFVLGRTTAPQSEMRQQAIAELRHQIHRQQGAVDRLAADGRRDVNALAARLAELQAASIRLDALGGRLAQMGQLSLDEFDFSAPAPVGGPEEYDAVGSADENELRAAIDALSEKLRRQSSQLDALQFLMVNRQLENDLTPSGWPVRKGWISSRYGERSDPFTGERAHHKGVDFAGTRGTEVLSVASGVVIRASRQASYGNTVEIDHGNGYRTRYAHNQELVVKPGDHVTAGQVIARMGSTGRSSAPHVHFEVLKDGASINPSGFVSHLR